MCAMALQQLRQQDIAHILGVQIEEEGRRLAACELVGGAARRGDPEGGKIEERSLLAWGRAGKAAPFPPFRGQHVLQPLFERYPTLRPLGGLENPSLQSEDAQYRRLVAPFGERDVAKHLAEPRTKTAVLRI